jgi:hypothetical protein
MNGWGLDLKAISGRYPGDLAENGGNIDGT